ncbi:EpsG family protein [Ligilactobacillus sp. LYQ135]
MLYVLIELFLFTYQLYKKDNRIIGLLGLLFLGYLCGTAGYQINDYLVYKINYNQVGTLGLSAMYFEKGYTNLGYMCYKMGMSYEQFRLFFSLLISIILFIGVSRFTKDICLFSFFYGYTLFFTDAVQVRSFMTIALVVLGISFIKKVNLRNIIISTFIILIAAQFQSLGYLFLSIIPLRILMQKKEIHLKNIFIYSTMLYTLFVIVGRGRITKIIGEIAALTGGRLNLQEKITTQYVTGGSIRTLVAVFIVTWGVIIMAYWLIKATQNESKQKVNDSIITLYSGILSSALILPFTYLAIDYARYPRGCAIFFIILICMIIPKTNQLSKDNKVIIYIGIFFVLLVIGLYYNLMWGHTFLSSIPYIIKFK